jgi:hypothetical protein
MQGLTGTLGHPALHYTVPKAFLIQTTCLG